MAKRQVIEFPGMYQHSNPAPGCIMIGNMVFSGAISGFDIETQSDPDGLDEQITNAFDNMRRTIEAAGGTTDNIARVMIYLHDMGHRDIVNREWVKMFPDAANRPVRKVLAADIPKRLHIQLEMTAVL